MSEKMIERHTRTFLTSRRDKKIRVSTEPILSIVDSRSSLESFVDQVKDWNVFSFLPFRRLKTKDFGDPRFKIC